MSENSRHQHFSPAPLCVSRFDKKTEILQLVCIGQNTQIYEIDGVSAFIWRQIDGKTSLKQIVSRICGEFEVSPVRAKLDVKKVIGLLLSMDIIQER